MPYLCAKNRHLSTKIKVAAVSYLNTKPLLYGIEQCDVRKEMTLELEYPSLLASSLQKGDIDMALLPVAAIPSIPNARMIGDYGIAADGNVASVAIFSQVPMEQITHLYLDYQSRTSVRLARLLLEQHWKQQVELVPATEGYIEQIQGTTAGVVIGDRALMLLDRYEYIYDLSKGWKEMTGKPFVFAAWVANKELPERFVEAFNKANAYGVAHVDVVARQYPFPKYDLLKYYTENIHYTLDKEKREGLQLFFEMISNS